MIAKALSYKTKETRFISGNNLKAHEKEKPVVLVLYKTCIH